MSYLVVVGSLLIVVLCIGLGQGVPQFVHEYVHIKVHVPKEAVRAGPRHNLLRGPSGRDPFASAVTWHGHLQHRRRPSQKMRLPPSRGRHQRRRPENEWLDRLLALDAKKKLARPEKQTHSYAPHGQMKKLIRPRERDAANLHVNMLKSHIKNAGYHCEALPCDTQQFKTASEESDGIAEYANNHQFEDIHDEPRGQRSKRLNNVQAIQYSVPGDYGHDDDDQSQPHNGGFEAPVFVTDAVIHAHIEEPEGHVMHPEEELTLPKHEHGYRPFYDKAVRPSDSNAAGYRYWPESENSPAAETYTGIDSYSAEHVQGLGSGVYQYRRTFL